jgi:hypothetical protein
MAVDKLNVVIRADYYGIIDGTQSLSFDESQIFVVNILAEAPSVDLTPDTDPNAKTYKFVLKDDPVIRA